MARYIDKDHWEEEILIPNTNTAILGGQPVWEGDRLVDGFANIPPAILADRTRHLKNRIDNIEADIDADFSSFIRKEDNLSDLEDIQQAKYNLGLNLVDNTRDLDKPVSVPQQEALDTKVDKEEGMGLSEESFTTVEKNKLAAIEEGAQVNTVTSVAGRVGDVILDKSDVGLSNVDNTADVDKPISNATAAALNTKADNSVSISAGNGLTGGGNLTTSRSLALGTPSTITGNTTNSVTSTSHTHEIQISTDDVDGLEGFVDNRVSIGNSASSDKLSSSRTISLTGDGSWSVSFDGSANVSGSFTLSNSGVTNGTYRSVTVDSKGRVIAGTNPTTLDGYGITDATPSSHIGSGGTSHAAVTTTVNGFMLATDKVKLNGIEDNATANQTDAFLLNRSNHTGTQSISTISGLQSALDGKVDKVAGMGLSQENFTTAEKNKLAGLEESHFKGLFPDLAALEAAVPSPVPGDYAQVAGANPGDPSVTYVWDDPLNEWVVQVPEISAEQVKSLYESNPDTNAFTDAEKSKLSGIAVGATANTGTVTSVQVSVPTGLQVTGGPVTSSGTLAISYQTGYSIPANTKQSQWDTAYGWGNHASVGYALSSSLSAVATSGNYNDLSNRPGVATTSVNGLMSSTDKAKLDGIAHGATANEGTVTSVNASVPVGFQVSGGPITSSGTLSISFASGYSLPTNAKQTQWDTAYGWGNHASAGYATTSDLTTGLSGKLDVGATAASANQLATARTINGTSFNGTANITTANWGTARTLTIGETGKSVNGSSNVTWSLTEIGAAPTIHTHTASQISDSTVVGRSVLTATDAATARAAIGAGISNLTIGTTAGTAKEGNWLPTSATKTNVLQGSSSSVFVTPSSYFSVISWATGTHSTGTVTLNLDTSLNHNLSVSGNITMASPSNADAGKTGDIVITMTANGTVSWDTNWKFLGSVPDIGASGEVWVISYKVLNSSFIIAAASKVAS